ncbi:MAG: hypothetical protein P0Y59_12710 [Candidatus Sphingomonas phytovorans]|nr:hypothetical protein [Sphingomonas sp.]WEJ97828.1 MAG: hypothetical protein P0Y59_12710 [Sphingomonas sp.]
MLRPLAAAVVLAATLSACGNTKTGTSISINSSDSDGNVVASMDGNTGAVAINVPGFSGKLNLPKIHLDANDFDMNGVHLYPGSTISGMNVEAHSDDKAGKNDDNANVRVSFKSPAEPGTVRDWFQQKLNAAGFSVAPNGNGLTGTTDEKKPFKLELTADGADTSKGVITIN